MPKSISLQTYTKFKGLNTNANQYTIAEDELFIARNVQYTTQGTIQRRPGMERLGGGGSGLSTLAGSTSLRMLCRQRTGATDRFFLTTGAKLYVCDKVGANMFEVLQGGASIANVSWGFQGFNGNAYFVRTTGAIIGVAPGVTAANLGGNIQGTTSVVFKDRQFIANASAAIPLDSRLYYSQILDNSAGTGFPASNFIDVSPGDGQFISALMVFNDQLVIFKNKSTWVLSADGSPSAWTLRQLHPYIGCVGRGTPWVIEGMLFFLSEEGVFRTDGVTFDEISKPIRNTLQGLTWDVATVLATDGAYFDNKYLFHLKSTNDSYVYDTITEGWSQWDYADGKLIDGFCVTTDTTYNYLHAGTITNNCLWRIGAPSIYTDDGDSYIAVIRFKGNDFGSPVEYKRHVYTDLDVAGNLNTYFLDHIMDRDITFFPASASVPGNSRNLTRFAGVGRFRHLITTLTVTGTNEFEIFGITFGLQLSPGAVDAH